MPCKAHFYPNGRFELWLNHPNDQIYFRLWERFIQDQHTLAGRKRKWVSSYFGYKVRLQDRPEDQPPHRGHQPKRLRVTGTSDSSDSPSGSGSGSGSTS
ncbi:hypothetical protein TWF694_002684 [Orbilia ellipsospora]|uniref:Uncharacterized protein n=1 Tax=Orbilia ellipsospora TaxID=2528407 RepID=A0AAV9X2N5_9PEZI